MQDEDIDLSEVPEVTEEQMARAVRVSVVFLCHAASSRVGMFLDAFIIEYFKAKPASRATKR